MVTASLSSVSVFASVRLPFEIPVDPDGQQAREWAIQELAKRKYQEAKPGLLEQIWEWISKNLQELIHAVSVGDFADARVLLLAVVLIVAILIALLIYLVRPRMVNRAKASESGLFDQNQELSAAEHRHRAQAAADKTDFDTAVMESFRAIARSAEERDVIVVEPGLTVSEVSKRLSRGFDSFSSRIVDAGNLFNRIRYSVRRSEGTLAGPADYEALKVLDRELQKATPVYTERATEWAVPQ